MVIDNERKFCNGILNSLQTGDSGTAYTVKDDEYFTPYEKQQHRSIPDSVASLINSINFNQP